MKDLIVNLDDFTEVHPTEPGIYMWAVGDSLSLITVRRVPAKNEYGIKWESYLGVVEHRGRDVNFLKGKFIKLKI